MNICREKPPEFEFIKILKSNHAELIKFIGKDRLILDFGETMEKGIYVKKEKDNYQYHFAPYGSFLVKHYRGIKILSKKEFNKNYDIWKIK